MWGTLSTYGYKNKMSNLDSNLDSGQTIVIKDEAVKEDHCLCHQIKWIWKLSQVVGMNPLSVRCEHQGPNFKAIRPKRQSHCKCQLEKRRSSISYVNCIIFFLLHFSSVIQVTLTMTAVLNQIFKGTDTYTCRIHLGARVWQTLTLISCGGIFSQNLIRAWESIQFVIRSLNYAFPKYIRRWSIGLSCLSMAIGLTNILYMCFTAIKFCLLAKDAAVLKACNSKGFSTQLIFMFTSGSSEIYHLTSASLLFIFALIVRSLSRGVADLMKERLESEDGDYFLELDEELERLRLLHERIYEIVVFLRKFFGVSALMICCNGVLTCIFGIYWRILYFENLSQDTETILDHFILFNMQMAFSVVSLLLVLIAGQLIANSSYYAIEVIRKSRLARLNSSARFQINLFLQSCSAFPTKFSVYFITNLEMRFLAAASTNVITYLLVLMQFRLEQENTKE